VKTTIKSRKNKLQFKGLIIQRSLKKKKFKKSKFLISLNNEEFRLNLMKLKIKAKLMTSKDKIKLKIK